MGGGWRWSQVTHRLASAWSRAIITTTTPAITSAANYYPLLFPWLLSLLPLLLLATTMKQHFPTCLLQSKTLTYMKSLNLHTIPPGRQVSCLADLEKTEAQIVYGTYSGSHGW